MAALRNILLALAAAVAVASCTAPRVDRAAEADRFRQYLASQPASMSVDTTQPLTMARAEEVAVANSLDLSVRTLSLRVQDENVKLAISQGLPHASAIYSESERSNAVAGESANGPPVKLANRTQRNLAIQAVAPVLDFGLTYYSYRIAVDQRAQDVLLIRRAEQLLRRDVRVAYTRHAGAIRQERLANMAYQASGQVLRTAKSLERAELAVPADTALVEAAVAQAGLEAAQASNDVRQTHLVLSQLMNLAPSVAFTIDPALPMLPPPPKGDEVAAWEDRALAVRPELAVQDLERQVSASTVRRDASAFFPHLDATGSFNWSNAFLAANPTFFLGGFQVTNSLLDGGATLFRYNQARRQADVEKQRTLLVSLGVLYDVDFAALRVSQNYDTVQAAGKLESSRRAALNRTISLYREGLEDEAGAARSLADLTAQATTLDQSQTEYLVSWHVLEAAVLPERPLAPSITSQPATAPSPTQGLSLPTTLPSLGD